MFSTGGMKRVVPMKMGYSYPLDAVIRYYGQGVLEYPDSQWAQPTLATGPLILMEQWQTRQ